MSCGLLGFEIALMRILLYASWYHFAFLVISAALLGFGTSGTVLCFGGDRWVRHGERFFSVLILVTAASIPLSVQLAQHVPVEGRFVPTLLVAQLTKWVVYWLILSLPFFTGATALGLGLILAGPRIPTVYAANLLGSATGAVLASVLMTIIPPAWLPLCLGAVVLLSFVSLARTRGRATAVLLAAAVPVLWLVLDKPHIRIDPYKYLASVQRLERDGNAKRIAVAYGPRAVVEVFSGPFHELPFLAVGESPPPISSIVFDGQAQGSLLHAARGEEARVVDQLLVFAAYAFAPPQPRVLLLGETGGANIWLALRRLASEIDVVQPNAKFLSLIRGPLRDRGGAVFEMNGVSVIESTPRHYVDRSDHRYDIVQLAALESWGVESAGIGGLSQDDLVTVEGLARAIDCLSPNGILAVARGIQLPPRDNAKLLATLVESMRSLGMGDPERHVVVLRDYLAACILIKRSPWTGADIAVVRAYAAHRQLTPVYFPGIRDDELNAPDRLPGPEGSRDDWLSYAARRLFSTGAASFIDEWAFDIRPPTDDRPFFANFTKLSSIAVLKRAFGDLWLTRTELALLFVVTAAVIVAVFGFLLTVAPLLFLERIRRAPQKLASALYFAAIGLGYLMIEMTFLSRITRLVGDPVLAGSLTIGAFLLFSGLGSIAAQHTRRPVWIFIVAMALVALCEGMLAGRIIAVCSAFSAGVRYAVAVVAIAPLAFFMGFPFPIALARLAKQNSHLVAWAWGMNGFASVLAPPLATAIGMISGFSIAGVTALALYLAAAALSLKTLRAQLA